MMKKRVLMPLLVAGVLMGIVVIHSCTKNQDQSVKAISYKAFYEKMNEDAPVIEGEVYGDRDVAEWICPYCSIPLHHLDSHWHYFGTPIPGFKTDSMMSWDTTPEGQPRFWPVAGCLVGLSDDACLYSGALEDDPEMIALLMSELGISDTVARYMLLPRFHAHMLKYRAYSSNGVNGGQNNNWHVGGGVPGWPTPEVVENP